MRQSPGVSFTPYADLTQHNLTFVTPPLFFVDLLISKSVALNNLFPLYLLSTVGQGGKCQDQIRKNTVNGNGVIPSSHIYHESIAPRRMHHVRILLEHQTSSIKAIVQIAKLMPPFTRMMSPLN